MTNDYEVKDMPWTYLGVESVFWNKVLDKFG